jgi:hypothetical protein
MSIPEIDHGCGARASAAEIAQRLDELRDRRPARECAGVVGQAGEHAARRNGDRVALDGAEIKLERPELDALHVR